MYKVYADTQVHRRITVLSSVTVSIALVLFLTSPVAYAVRLKDLCEVQGARGNAMIGIGLVVGLSGTGDKVAEAVSAQQRVLRRLNVDVDNLGNLRSDNAAVVIVTGEFPAFAKEGTRFDVQVSSWFNCESLEGGILLRTYLLGEDERVYAVAQGPVSVGGFNADAGGANVRQNHVTVGRVPLGAFVEREIPSTITDGERITLLLKRPSFQTATRIKDAINNMLGSGMAQSYGAGAVNIRIPHDEQRDLIGFIARLQDLDVQTTIPAKVVVNERTGTIVVGGDVVIKPCQVAHGNLTIQIGISPVFPEPPAVAFEADPRQAEMTDMQVIEQEAFLMPVEGSTAADVAQALNRLKVTPRDMIAIFQALAEAGALEADLEIM